MASDGCIEYGGADTVQDCWVTVWEGTVEDRGRCATFYGPKEVPNLDDYKWGGGGDIYEDIQSIQTGLRAWFIGWEQTGFRWERIQVGPDSFIGDTGEHGWKDRIQSFRLSADKPPDWM